MNLCSFSFSFNQYSAVKYRYGIGKQKYRDKSVYSVLSIYIAVLLSLPEYIENLFLNRIEFSF